MTDAIPTNWTYAMVGGAVLGLAAWLMWELAKRMVVRGKAEGDLDQRLTGMITVITAPLTAIIDSERANSSKLQDRLQDMTTKFMDFVSVTTDRHNAELQQMRTEAKDEREKDRVAFQAQIREANARIDECEKGHRMDRSVLDVVQQDMKEIRDRQYQQALATPAAPVLAVDIERRRMNLDPPPAARRATDPAVATRT